MRALALGLVALLATACSPAATSGTPAAPPATAAVTRQDVTATTPVTATLGYAGAYQVSVPPPCPRTR